MRNIVSMFVSVLVVSVAIRVQAVPLIVLDADFSRTQLEVNQIGDGKLQALSPAGAVQRELRDIVLLERASVEPRVDEKQLTIILRDGQRYGGSAGVFQNDIVSWNTPWTGTPKFPLEQISRIVRGTAFEDEGIEPGNADLILLTNGDRVTGIITEIGPVSLSCRSSDGQDFTVEWPNVHEVVLARTAGKMESPPAAWRVLLVNGSVCDLQQLSLRDNSVVITRQGEQFRIAPDTILSIENLTGRAQLLTRLPAASRDYSPYFPRTGSAASIEVPTSVRIGDARSSSFITVRPYSRLTWNIGPGTTSFKTRYLAGPGGQLTNCQLRIYLDDKMVMDVPNVTASTPLGTFETPTNGARTLTLEVDFGENFDVQDQLYWIEPAFISK